MVAPDESSVKTRKKEFGWKYKGRHYKEDKKSPGKNLVRNNCERKDKKERILIATRDCRD